MESVFTIDSETKFVALLKEYKMKKYLKTFYNFKKNIESLKYAAERMNFSIDFVDDDGLSPLHLACIFNQP